jgi:PAS domain S-box-containing protein
MSIREQIRSASSSGRRLRTGTVVFAIGIAVLAAAAVVCLFALSGVTAFASARAAWATAQKSAVQHLLQYAASGDEREYRAFQAELAIPLGDRQAWLELARVNPNNAIARDGFLNGGNSPDDVDAMIMFYRIAGRRELFQRAMDSWQLSDAKLSALTGFAARLHGRMMFGSESQRDIAPLLHDIEKIDYELAALESSFAHAMNLLAARLHAVLAWLAGAFITLLALFGFFLSRHVVDRDGHDDIVTNEEMLRSVFDGAAIGIAATGTGGRYLRTNQTLCDMLGYSETELLNLTCRDTTHPDFLDRTDLGCEGLLTGSLDHWATEKRYIRKNRTMLWARVTATLHRAADGTPRHFVVVMEDVTARRATEDALRRSEEKFRTLSQAAFDGIIVAKDGVITETNDATSAMFGYSRQEVVGRGVSDLTTAAMRGTVDAHLSAGSFTRYESYGLSKDGTSFPVEICGASLENGIRITALRDIRKRREAENALRNSEEKFRTLSLAAFDGIAVLRDGLIVEANPAFAAMHSYTPAELIGMSPGMLAGAAGWPLDGESRTFETEGRRRDGARFPVEICVAPFGARGDAHVVSSRDLTARFEADRALREREETFRALIENASDLITVISSDGTISYESPSVERLLGYPPEELIGSNVDRFVHANDLRHVRQAMRKQRQNADMTQSIELRLRHHDGSWREFEVMLRNVIQHGEVTGVIANSRDVTDRKMLESQLEQASRMQSLGRLAAMVAHEFNNILMGIQPFAELVARRAGDDDGLHRASVQIKSCVNRGKRVTSGILRFTRPAEPEKLRIDANQWLDDIAAESRGVVGAGIIVCTELPSDSLAIVGDRAQLSQLLMNLILNSRDAMPDGGTLTLGLRSTNRSGKFPFGVLPHPERFVHVTVRDDGAGMTEETVHHLFEPLFTTKKSGGTGLGLAISRQIVEMHGGLIFAESTLTLGTTFHIFLPLGEADVKTAFPLPLTAAPVRRLNGRKVLIVEDEAPVAEGLRALLELEGVHVERVGLGSEAAAAAEQLHPDAVILDIGLPDCDGVEVYRRLALVRPDLPVVFSSGHGDATKFEELLSRPHVEFLQKPYDMITLTASLTRVLWPPLIPTKNVM